MHLGGAGERRGADSVAEAGRDGDATRGKAAAQPAGHRAAIVACVRAAHHGHDRALGQLGEPVSASLDVEGMRRVSAAAQRRRKRALMPADRAGHSGVSGAVA